MLGVEFFNHDILDKYTTVFGTLFNDIYVHRVSNDRTKLQVIPVPISHSGSEKFVSLDEQNPITAKVQTQLPRMAYELTNISFAQDRAISPIVKNVKLLNPTTMKTQYAETPYNLEFQLSIYTRSINDANQIVGQIIPFFRPSFTPTIKIIPGMDLKFDSKVQLNSIDINNDYQGSTDETRIVTRTLNFTMNAYFFGPISTQGVIKRAIVDLIAVPGQGPITGAEIEEHGRSSRIVVYPGLDANGQPTTDPDKAIPYQEVDAEDPYAYITTVEFFDDNLKYDPITGTDK